MSKSIQKVEDVVAEMSAALEKQPTIGNIIKKGLLILENLLDNIERTWSNCTEAIKTVGEIRTKSLLQRVFQHLSANFTLEMSIPNEEQRVLP